MKKVNGKIISALIGAVITLVVVLVGPMRGMVTQDDLKNRPTKLEVQYMIKGVEDISEYDRDKRMLMSHMDRTIKKLDSIEKGILDLRIAISVLESEVKNIKNNLPKKDN